ncbi:activator of 90 kDa heat shock protein ATPase homolog 1-like [Zophobas morio]|uniref:activator of 90 kDa heat shock protein ATPase homolog 1-like n=1 Tax=Zophobas morio TaxID=2755281 RepID=UPI003083042A
MAKWGEGDPRWICELRSDATNVNNWHWTEWKYTNFTIKSLNQLFTNKALVEFGSTTVSVTKVKVEGETYANNRKGKVILTYDHIVEFTLNVDSGSDKSVEGSICIDNFDDTNDLKDLEIRVSLKEENGALRELIRTKGGDEIRNRLQRFREVLWKDASSTVLLPTKPSASAAPNGQSDIAAGKFLSAGETRKPDENKKTGSVGCRIHCKAYERVFNFKCSATAAYAVFVDEQQVKAWAGHTATIDPHVGGAFSLFDGNVSGTFTKLVPGSEIQMSWRRSGWPDGHYSLVVLSFREDVDCTRVSLKQRDIPETHYQSTSEGWPANYFQRINSVFGYGANFGAF